MNGSTGSVVFYPTAEDVKTDVATDSTPQSVSTARSRTPDSERSVPHASAATSSQQRRPFDAALLAETINNIHAAASRSNALANPQETLCLHDAIRNIHCANAETRRYDGINGDARRHYDRHTYGGPHHSVRQHNHIYHRDEYTKVDDHVLVETIENVIADVMARKQAKNWLKDVWRDDVDWTFRQIASIAEEYNYVAIDTEFPGTILQHDDPSLTQSSLNYLDLRDNVNQLSVIQLGLTFSDEFGNRPKISTFQFNLKFDLSMEQHDPRSIDMLKKAGVDFNRHLTEGIDVRIFAERMLASGLLLNENIRWICFHGMYDFGYLARVLSHLPLPDTPILFFQQLYQFFPKLVDLKHLLRDRFSGGLNSLAKAIGVKRCGAGHTGGSDARLTSDIFFRVVSLSDRRDAFSGSLFGLEPEEFTGCDQWSWDLYNKDYYKHDYSHFFGLGRTGIQGLIVAGYEGWYDFSSQHPQIMY